MKDLVENLNYILNTYQNIDDKVVDKNQHYYYVLVNDIPKQVDKWLDNSRYLVTGSVGQGNKTNFPWVCTFNKNITTTAQKGIYLGYLFRKDMSGFYLTLMQGVTYFDNKYHSNQYEAMRYTVSVIQDIINTQYFNTNKIDLRVKNKSRDKLGYGYENSTIISKLYTKNNFSYDELKKDFIEMLEIYEDLYLQFQYEGYEGFIKSILEKKWIALYEDDILTRKMNEEILKESGLDKASVKEISVSVVDPDDYDKPQVVSKSSKILRKTDYIKKAKRDSANGFLGEQTVIFYEKERLSSLGRKDLADRVRSLSNTSDSFGFDILSFDVNDKDVVVPRLIEVKSTSSEEDAVVYFSENEIEVSKKHKAQYWVYRVIDVKGKKKKLYMKQGSIEENYALYPTNYKGYRKF
ncbi:MAG: MrcB family domain-containing protein [Bacillota bacterium]